MQQGNIPSKIALKNSHLKILVKATFQKEFFPSKLFIKLYVRVLKQKVDFKRLLCILVEPNTIGRREAVEILGEEAVALGLGCPKNRLE